jgi:hypothetical protein
LNANVVTFDFGIVEVVESSTTVSAPIALVEQTIYEMRSDEAGGASNQDGFHIDGLFFGVGWQSDLSEIPLWILARLVGDNTKGAVAASLCRPHSKNSFCSVNPKMPAPARSERPLQESAAASFR